jgi:hypothetical protein
LILVYGIGKITAIQKNQQPQKENLHLHQYESQGRLRKGIVAKE